MATRAHMRMRQRWRDIVGCRLYRRTSCSGFQLDPRLPGVIGKRIRRDKGVTARVCKAAFTRGPLSTLILACFYHFRESRRAGRGRASAGKVFILSLSSSIPLGMNFVVSQEPKDKSSSMPAKEREEARRSRSMVDLRPQMCVKGKSCAHILLLDNFSCSCGLLCADISPADTGLACISGQVVGLPWLPHAMTCRGLLPPHQDC